MRATPAGSATNLTGVNLDQRGVPPEREFFIDNLLVRIHFIIVMIGWTGLAPWEFEFPFPGSLTSTFLRRHKRAHGGRDIPHGLRPRGNAGMSREVMSPVFSRVPRSQELRATSHERGHVF